MLDNNLLLTIGSITTPETFKGVVSLENIFADIGYSDHEHVIMGILSEDSSDTVITAQKIEHCYASMVSSLYAKYCITVNTESTYPLYTHATVLAGLLALASHENIDIFSLAKEAESYEEALIILLNEITPLGTGFLMGFILECENKFINNKVDAVDILDISENENIDVASAKSLLAKCPELGPILHELLNEVGFIENPGYSFDAVLSFYLTERDFASMFSEVNIKVLLLLSHLSRDTVTKCKEMLIESLDDRIAPTTYMSVVKRINTIFG